MLCPTCKVELTITDRQGVEIDFCPKCRGVWLDRGELDKILERSSASTPASTSRGDSAPATGRRWQNDDHDDDDDDNDYDDDRGRRYGQQGAGQPTYPRRKKSWLGNLFDFD